MRCKKILVIILHIYHHLYVLIKADLGKTHNLLFQFTNDKIMSLTGLICLLVILLEELESVIKTT